MFQSFQSFLAYLLALLVVYACLRVFRPAFLRDAGRELRRQFGIFGCVFLFCTVSLLAGRVVSKNILRSPPSPQLIPEWFTALGYDPTDTDGDGIPDCWERWTRTNRAEADDELDPDGDGVDNFGEFWNQCDPMMADTDGDGYSDYVEIAGKAVGKTWYDPIVPASYVYEDPDANTNGVPDRWEGTGYVYGFTDWNHDGFPDGLTFPEAGGGNFDIEVTVTTSRSALLSWGEGTSKGIVLPPCDGLVVRLRLSGLTDSDVRLSSGTLGDGSEGLWKARMSIRWPDDCGYETEGNRIRIQADEVIDCDAMTVSYRGEVQTTPTRTPGGVVPTSITSPFRRRWLYINGLGGDCWEHSPGGWWAEAIYTNIAPPFAWYVNDNPVPPATGDGFTGGDIHSYWNGETPVVVRCEWTNGPPHSLIKLEATETIGMYHCPPSTTNIIGAARASTHNPTNATDHLPYATNTVSFQWGPNCPETIERTYFVGWDHEKVNTRNLPVIVETDIVDHCLGLIGSRGTIVHLSDYLDIASREVRHLLRFRVNGSVLPKGSDSLVVSRTPNDLNPVISFVEVLDDELTPLDYLWVVVSCQQSKQFYDGWKTAETNLTWTLGLPKPFSSLFIATNSLGKVVASDTGLVSWGQVEAMNPASFMHHNAHYEMRSLPIVGGHGHQATYNVAGVLITSTIAAGTADKVSPQSIWNGTTSRHRLTDVLPYIRALQLDGNPVLTDNASGMFTDGVPTRFTRPCLFQGEETDAYLERRPPTPTGVQH